MEEVVRGDEEVGGRRLGRGGHQIVRNRHLPRTGGIRDLDAIAFRPHRAVRTCDARRDEERPAVGRRRLHDPDAATVCPEVHDVGVFGRPVSVRQRGQRRAHAGDLTQGVPHLVHDVRGVRSEPAPTLALVGPPFGNLARGTGEERDVQQEGRQTRLAYLAGAHHPRHQRRAGTPAELRTEEVHDSRVLGLAEQDAGLGRVPRERLLAQDVLPRAHRLRGDRRMGVRRCRDRDGVDIGERECLGERCRRQRHVEALGALPGPAGIASHERAHREARGAQRPHMGEAAEARTDDGRIQIAHPLPSSRHRTRTKLPQPHGGSCGRSSRRRRP